MIQVAPQHPSRPSTRALRQRGVTMIEALVAIVLVALGVLAVAALQLTAKRGSLDARQRTDASQIAYVLLERLRANNSSAGLAAYLEAAQSGFGNGAQGATPDVDCAAAGAECDARELALYDAWAFEQEIDGAAEAVGANNTGGLVAPFACLSASPPGGVSGMYSLTVAWRGASVLPSNTAVACGRGRTLGGAPAYGADDEYRRTLTFTAFVIAR